MLINEKDTGWIVGLGLVALVLIASTGLAVVAAQAEPEERLYPLAQKLEQVQLSLTFGEIQKDRLRLQLANKRLSDIDRLLVSERPDFILIEQLFGELDDLIEGVSSYEHRARSLEIAHRSERLSKRVAELSDICLEHFAEQMVALKQQLAETDTGAPATATVATEELERKLEHKQQQIEHHQTVRTRIQHKLDQHQANGAKVTPQPPRQQQASQSNQQHNKQLQPVQSQRNNSGANTQSQGSAQGLGNTNPGNSGNTPAAGQPPPGQANGR